MNYLTTYLLENKILKKTVLNKKIKNILISLVCVLLFSSLNTNAQDIPKRPYPARLVNDYSNLLTQQESQNLENALVNFSNSTSTQVVVVIVPKLNGYSKAEYAYEIGEKWGVGKKGSDNGIVMLIKPKTYNERGEAYILVGYGLESVIPDAIAKRIVEKEMIPYFKRNNYYQGIASASSVIMSLSLKEYSATDYKKKTQSKPYGFSVIFIIFIIIYFFMRSGGRRSYSMGGNLPFLAMLLMMGGGGRGGSSGSWSDFSSGSGGFGGFGGGSFGGGGAGGSW